MAGGNFEDPRRHRKSELRPRGRHPAEERLPNCLSLLAIETLKSHSYDQVVVPLECHDVPPMGVQQVLGVKLDELPDQPAKHGIRCGADRREHAPEIFRQLVRP